MDDAGPPAVEFLGSAPGRDEVLAGLPVRDSRHRVLVLLGALLAVVGGALAARAAQGSGPAPAVSTAAVPSRAHALPPGYPTAHRSPVPAGCQTAACVVVSGIPPSTARAVHVVFPTAVLQEGYSIRSADLRSLRSRNIRGVLDGAGLVLDVGAAPPVAHVQVSGRRAGTAVRVVARVSRYRITITVADPQVALRDVMRLARQPALIALR